MGAFFTNISLKTNDLETIKVALKDKKVFVSSNPIWITIYPQETEEQDIATLHAFTQTCSSMFRCPAIAFLVHDSDALIYYYYKNGDLIDAFTSLEEFIEDESEDTQKLITENNHGALLKEIAKEGVTEDQINNVFSSKHVFAEDKLIDLVKVLGIDTVEPIGYKYLVDEKAEHPNIQPLN